MAERTYVIQSRPPVRAFVVAAVAALVGALLLVGSFAWGWHVLWGVLGGLALVAGVALTIIAFLSIQRLAVHLTLDDEGYKVSGSEVDHAGQWRDVTKVTRSQEGSHVTIYHGVVRRTHLLFPAGDAAQIEEILADVRARLQAANRGK